MHSQSTEVINEVLLCVGCLGSLRPSQRKHQKLADLFPILEERLKAEGNRCHFDKKAND